MLQEITKCNPWFPRADNLDIDNWKKAGKNLKWVQEKEKMFSHEIFLTLKVIQSVLNP